MKKVAIVTHCIANNFGANLQALSTACYLKDKGYEPIFITWGDYLITNTPPEQVKIHTTFLKDNGFIVSPPCHSDNDFINVIKDYNIKNIIVGSDCVLTYKSQRFPYKLTKKGFQKVDLPKDYAFPNPFWLPYLRDRGDIKRFLMSASCGGSDMGIISNDILKEMKELISYFDYISVRDSFTKKFLQRIVPERIKSISITPDPVFGFNVNVPNVPSETTIRDKFNILGDYLLISFYKGNWPDQKWSDRLMDEAHQKGFKCVSMPMPQGGRNSSFDIDLNLPLDPLEWYALIKYSKGYIGNNMHPVIVALHNKIPFFSYNIHGRSIFRGRIQLLKTSKEYDLLKRFGLENNLIPQPFINYFSPKKVLSRILTIDKKVLSEASEKLQQDYLSMMESIIFKFI